MTLTPRFAFGNIRGVRSMSFPFSRGVSPSVCTVTINPGVQLDRQPHAMTISDGFRSVSFRDCIISDVSPQRGGDGLLSIMVSILDRRWRWKYGQISGSYNVRKAGEIIPSTRRNARQLAALCFEACGERRFDVRQVPTDAYPHIDWDMQRPDAALDQLCQHLNCHVTLRHDDMAAIYRDGFGLDLPNLPSSSQGEGYDYGSLPGQVGVASAPVQWQLDLPLVPVGQDTDGKIKRIDKLSYRPKTGWENAGDPDTLRGVRYPDGVKAELVRKLAEETVFRWYAITLPKSLKKMPMIDLPIRSVNQLLPILDHQLDIEEYSQADELLSDKDFNKSRKQVQVYGLFYDESGLDSNSGEEISRDLKKNPKLVYEKSFQIDNERALVKFADPVYLLGRSKGASVYKWADLRLRAAVNFHHPVTRAPYRLQFRRNVFRGGGAGVDWDVREDIVPEWKKLSSGRRAGKAIDNRQEVFKQLNYYLDYAQSKYAVKAPASGTYPMTIPASPDGRIAQVIYEIDSTGFIATSIHKEIEGLTNIVPYEERRKQLAQLASLQKLQQRSSKQDENKRGKS